MKYLLSLTLFLAPCCYAIDAEQPANVCFDELTSCFTKEGVQRSNCFYTVAGDAECAGTEEGKLVYKRWALSTSTTVGGDTPPGLLGPILYDDACILSCDNEWLSDIVGKTETSLVITKVKKCLEACKKPESLEVLRP